MSSDLVSQTTNEPSLVRPFVLIGLAALFLWGLIGCQSSDPSTVTPGKTVVQEIFDFTTHHTKDNVLQWTLKAESAIFLESDRIQVTKPNVMIYENGKPTVAIHADAGEIYEDVYDLLFTGNVKAVHADVTIYTQEMHWLNESGEIYAPGRVKMVRGDSVMYGNRLSADPRLKKAHLYSPDFRIYSKDEKTYVPIQ